MTNQTETTNTKVTPQAIETSKTVGPEDLRRGDYVAVSHTIHECLRWRCEYSSGDSMERVEVKVMSEPGETELPLKVVDICLPFVLTRTPRRKHVTLDVRQCRLVRLSARFGKRAFDRLRKDHDLATNRKK